MIQKFIGARLALAPLAICLLTMLTVIMTACGATAAGSGNNQNTVHMDASNFTPPSITIKKEQSLTLVNDVSAIHIIENGTWDNNGTPRANIEPGAPKVDAQMNGGDSKTFGPFNTAGTFQLFCPIHAGMNLTVIVQ
jgi:plastocyanin